MLVSFDGKSNSYCDGISRRSALKLGIAGICGLTMADLLRAEDAAGTGSSHKAIINIHLGGGPSHSDMFDLKPDAPIEYRGEFNPINTNVPGFDICEHFPKLATMADKFAAIRSLVGMHNDHSNFHTQSGWGRRELQGQRPALGSVLARMKGSTASGAPPFVSYNGGSPGFLGPVYQPYRPSGKELRLHRSITADRLKNRTALLGELDNIRRDIDHSGQLNAIDSFTEQAVGVVTSGKVADALDLNKEDAKLRERYGKSGSNFLLARRLVEAGVRCVTFNWGGWDTHGNNFKSLKTQLPRLDIAMSALLQDLYDRGMDQDVTVVMWGEFGRTPRVNRNAGRDHWPQLAMAFLAGGGMRLGQAVGRSTKYAEQAKDRPVHLQEVFSTLYHNLGINPETTTLVDTNGRPQFLTNYRTPIKELI